MELERNLNALIKEDRLEKRFNQPGQLRVDSQSNNNNNTRNDDDEQVPGERMHNNNKDLDSGQRWTSSNTPPPARRRKLCGYEFQIKDSCPYGKGCRFEHTIPDSLRNSNEIKKRMQGILDRLKKNRIGGARKPEEKEMCRFERQQEGKCWYKNRCRFSHNLSKEAKRDQPAGDEKDGRKGERKAEKAEESNKKRGEEKGPYTQQGHRLCLHEFETKGSCRYKKNCKFDHRITDEMRNTVELQIKMRKLKQKWESNVKSKLGDDGKAERSDRSETTITKRDLDTFLYMMKTLIQNQQKDMMQQ